MTHKEEAKELVKQFRNLDTPDFRGQAYDHDAKQCALICEGEKIKLLEKLQQEMHSDEFFYLETEVLKLKEIKQEIEKL